MRNFFYHILSAISLIFNYSYKNNLRVLAYHDIKDEKQFYLQINYLSKHYNIVSLEQVRNHILHQAFLPPYSLLITFDDGDRSVLEKGLPVLKRFDIASCLFIITSLINTEVDFWFNAVRKMEKLKGKDQQEIESLMKWLKTLTNFERVNEIKKYNFPNYKQLTSEDLVALQASKVFIANHSHTHPMFNKCNREELREEFKITLTKFKEFGFVDGHKYFAYPNGNWNNASEDILKEMGIEMAFLFDHNINKKRINPYRISRLRANSDMSIDELKVKVSGLHSFLQKLKS
jgi:peptidoglycan/xylan/chitin deacetylase (PgdA/CDA1 family)